MLFYNIFIFFIDIILGVRIINERKVIFEEKNVVRMICCWKKYYLLMVVKCYNLLIGMEENCLMVDGKMVLRLSEIGFVIK